MSNQTSAPGSAGVGQQTPYTSNSDLTVAIFMAKQIIGLMETMKLVKIVNVHGGGNAIARAGTVDCQLLVSQIDGDGNSTKQGIVYGIPYWRMQGGKNGFICDPVAGDIGFVLCCDRDISNVKAAAEGGQNPQTTPGSFRKFSVSDGIYIGGCLNDAPTTYLAFTANGIVWRDAAGNVLESKGAAGFEMTPASGGVFKVNGSIQATNEITAKAGTPAFVNLSTHTTTSFGTPPTPGT